jgi:hypothetical protein
MFKQFFADMKSRLLVIGILIIAAVAFIIDMLMSKNNGLQAQVAEVKDQKQADVLESKVNQELSDASLKQSEINSNQAALDALAAKRTELPKQQDLSATQVEAYWNQPK